MRSDRPHGVLTEDAYRAVLREIEHRAKTLYAGLGQIGADVDWLLVIVHKHLLEGGTLTGVALSSEAAPRGDAIYEALRSYRSSRWRDSDGEPMELLDLLGPDEPSVEPARTELRHIAEHIADELPVAGRAALDANELLREQRRHYEPFTALTDEEVKRGADALMRELGEWGSDRMHAQWARIVLDNALENLARASRGEPV